MKIKIGFLWHNVSSGNLGVGALSISNMLYIKDVLNKLGLEGEYYTIGDNEETTPGNKELVELQTGIKFTHISFSVKQLILSPSKLWRYHSLIKSMDMVLDIGAGDSFSDIYGFKRFFIQVFTKIHAAKYAKIFILSPQTIGPFFTKKAKLIGKYILNKSDFVFARDQQSFNVANQLAPTANLILSTDVALRMPYEGSNRNSAEINVGINVSGLLWNEGYNGNNDFRINHSYQEFVRKAVEHFSTLDNVKVHLVSHVISTIPSSVIEDDYIAAKKLKDEHFKNNDAVILVERFTNPIIAKTYISKMDFFTGARMHATIAAFSSGVPCLPYAYSRKFSGLFNTFGFRNVLEAREMGLEEALAKLTQSYDNRDEIKNELRKCSEIVEQLGINYSESLKKIIEKKV
ncbi:TPA: polysaccharide pyruvyl transferase family protein [Citrobacter farmeri]|uniref:polysaccharide pyruvyl transferase family protein n=1 Tax=Citrobacter farmeri TaxID=67824 RepID=UPI003890F1BF|nr:polysaccharide pyruvyl transferase family protein [Citrobacter farmeri]